MLDYLRWAAALVALLFIIGLGIAVFVGIFTKQINLRYLIGDREGSASMSRFQILVFTFVVALAFLYLVVAPDSSAFPNVPTSVLTLLGITGTSYLVSKGIDAGDASMPPDDDGNERGK